MELKALKNLKPSTLRRYRLDLREARRMDSFYDQNDQPVK